MISISTDLFQTIALALMLIILIALLALLSAISGLRKSLGSGGARDSSSATTYGDTASYASYGATTPADAGYGYGAPAAAVQPRQEISTGYVPLSQATPAAAQPATAQPAASTAAPMLTGSEPEEQPFERDGRWWFKRGGDLLVYDEGTGQWVAAGAGAPVATATGTTTAEQPAYAAASGDVGEGWKCSSCGAVNGSTATVCRMCFTPR